MSDDAPENDTDDVENVDGTTDTDDSSPGELETLRNENQRLKREQADAQKARRQAEKAAKDAANQKAKEQGDWQKLAEEAEKQAAEATARAEEAEARIAQAERQQRVSTAAQALSFRDPSDAHLFLTADEMDDPKLLDAALKRLKKQKPYLIAEPRRTGADHDGGSNSGDTPEEAHNKLLAGLIGGS